MTCSDLTSTGGVLLISVLLSTVGLAGCVSDGSETTSETSQLREATVAYDDVSMAREDGYAQFSPKVPGMGYHYLDASAVNDDGTSDLDRSLEVTEPEILVYTGGEDDADKQLAAVEYAIPKEGSSPPQEAVELFPEADASDWHVHPAAHEIGLESGWTIHAECHYEGGAAVFLAENPNGSFVRLTPGGPAGTWSGTIAPDQCPQELDGDSLPPLLLVHGKWWTLHAWVWMDNPEGLFHPTNPNVGS